MHLIKIIFNSLFHRNTTHEFLLNQRIVNEVPEPFCIAIKLILDPTFNESYNFDDFIQNSSDSSRPFVEILVHQKEKIYSDEEIISIKRFLDNPEYVLINELPIRFSKFQESLPDFGYLTTDTSGVLHFLDSQNISKILSWNLQDSWKTVKEVIKSEEIIRLVKQKSAPLESALITKSITSNFTGLNLEVTNAETKLKHSTDYFKLKKKYNAVLKIFVEKDIELMTDSLNRTKSRIQELETNVTDIEHNKLDTPVYNLQINRQFLLDISKRFKALENKISFPVNLNGEDVGLMITAKRNLELSISEEFEVLENLLNDSKKLSNEKDLLKADLDAQNFKFTLARGTERDQLLKNIRKSIEESPSDLEKLQKMLKIYSDYTAEIKTFLANEIQRIEEFSEVLNQFPVQVQSFCARSEDLNRKLTDLKKELIQLELRRVTHILKYHELVQTFQLDEKIVEGIQKIYEFVLSDDSLISNFYGPIFQFLRDDVEVESKVWMGISPLVCVILFREKRSMEKVAVEFEGSDYPFTLMSLDSIYTQPLKPMIPSDLTEKITFAKSLIKPDSVIRKALELIIQQVLYIEDPEDLKKFKTTRYNVSTNKGGTNLFNNILAGGHNSNSMVTAKIKVLNHIYNKIKEIGNLGATIDRKSELKDATEHSIEEEDEKLLKSYGLLVKKFSPAFWNSHRNYETLLSILQDTIEAQKRIQFMHSTREYFEKFLEELPAETENFDRIAHKQAVIDLTEKITSKQNELDNLAVQIKKHQDQIESKISKLQDINSKVDGNTSMINEALKNQLDEFNVKQKEFCQEFNDYINLLLETDEKPKWVGKMQKNQQNLEKQCGFERNLKRIECQISEQNVKMRNLKEQLASYKKILDDLNRNGVRAVDEELYNDLKNSNINDIHDAIQTIGQELDECEPHLAAANYLHLKKCIDRAKRLERNISNGQTNEHLSDLFAYEQKYVIKILREICTNYEISFNLILKEHVESCNVVFSTAAGSGLRRLNDIEDSFDMEAINFIKMRVKYKQSSSGQLLDSTVSYIEWILLILQLIRNLSNFNFVMISKTSIENLGPNIGSRFRKYLDILGNYVQIVIVKD